MHSILFQEEFSPNVFTNSKNANILKSKHLLKSDRFGKIPMNRS
jgi:hypothetical protein